MLSSIESIGAPHRTIKLAIASLTLPILAIVYGILGIIIGIIPLSFISGITLLGFILGIVCGHLARSRIKKNPQLHGSRLALAGLVVGYSFLSIAILLSSLVILTEGSAVAPFIYSLF